MSSLASARSLLFAPGNDGHKLEKALSAGADVVVADLEDAVPAGEKDAARRLVAEQLAERRTESLVAVRLNGAGTPFRDDDLPGVAALALGAVDLGLELGLEPRPDGQEVLLARSQLVLDSAAAGIRAPFDLVHLDTRDAEGLEHECRLARSLGFRGKLCIHPAQVQVVNRIFSPREDEVERARRVIDVYERGAAEGRGVVALDGEMVDLPVVERARQVLAQAERSAPDGS